MRPNKNGSRSKNQQSSPRSQARDSNSTTKPSNSRGSNLCPPSTTLIDDCEVITDLSAFENLSISTDFVKKNNNNYYNNTSPRSFPYSVKQQCWDKAEKVKGRDPERWRRDSIGNTVFRKLVGCPGCLCHDYDHILPYSKGGQSTLENCQVLQAHANRSKGNKTELSKADLIQKSSYCRVSGRDMDLIELSAYGNVRRGEDSGVGCSIQ